MGGIEPMTPWSPAGARWHVHLAPDEALDEIARELSAVLEPYSERMSVLDRRWWHCTLAWIPERPVTLQRRLGRGQDEIRDALLDRLRWHLHLALGEAREVPLLGLGWGKGGPHLRVSRDAADPLLHAAHSALVDVAGTHWVSPPPPPGTDLHIALGYATTTWTPDEVHELDTALRDALRDVDFPRLPTRLLVCMQDTFGADGLAWTEAYYLQPGDLHDARRA